MFCIKELFINEKIRAREVRVVDSDGEQLGVIPTKEALRIALEKKLDLVMVSPNAKPPVCKILDYGKYRYEQSKREKEAKKNQKTINIKEVRMTPRIDDHDLQVKASNAIKFLKAENKVKVTVRFRGRELGHTNIGREVLKTFVTMIQEYGEVEKLPRMEGRNMVMFLTPKK